MQIKSLPVLFMLSFALVACGEESDSDSGHETVSDPDTVSDSDDGADGEDGSDPEPALHTLTATIRLTPDADGTHVTFPTQNGSLVAIPTEDIIGKTVFWVTTPGGEPVTNAEPIDAMTTKMNADLTSIIRTPAHYGEGPWELAAVVTISGSVPPAIPAPGDLAAFDLSQPPAGEPAQTGVSVRFRVEGDDAEVVLDNSDFIRIGK